MKGETNHWWLRRPDREQFTLLRWDQVLADTAGYEHICSESCAAKALSKWMAQIGSQVSARVAIQTEVPLRTQ